MLIRQFSIPAIALSALILAAACGDGEEPPVEQQDVGIDVGADTGPDADVDCPVAAAEVTSGDNWEEGSPYPGSLAEEVSLSGQASTDPGGTELSYEWRFSEMPVASHSHFAPSPHVEDPVIRLDVPGAYEVELTVYSEQGIESCEPATISLTVPDDYAVHVQLAWQPVSDPDDTFVDLDLHYVHGDGTWGYTAWSINPYNVEDYWADSHVFLDQDSVDGEWPENIYHAQPEAEMNYHVGAHRVAGSGTVEATVRVLFYGELVYESDPRIFDENGQLWYVGDIEWMQPPIFAEINSEVDDHPL